MRYDVVFDVVRSGYRQLPFAAFGLIFVAIGIGLVHYRRQLGPRYRRFFPFGYLGFAVVWTLSVLVATYSDYSKLASALREGRSEVVEGDITDFHPMPHGGHELEWFVVDGERFEYSDYNVTAGFNNTASHGGPIREGIRVRVHHINHEIARLEVARKAGAGVP